jgi:hypothetical protein
MRADSAILQRLIHMTYWLAPLILRLGTNQHLAHPGDIVFRHACAMGLEGIVSKRLGALHFRALEGLAQLQESDHWPVRSLITWIGGGLLCIPLHPFPAARTNPG